MCSGKARDVHQGTGRVGNLLDVQQKLGLLDRQGSFQIRDLRLWAQASGLIAPTAFWSPVNMGQPCVLPLQGAPEVQ